MNLLKNSSTASELLATDLVLCEEINGKGIVTFNRPKALNAFNFEMLQKVLAALTKWQNTMSIIIVKGAGEKAFCVGGDVRAIVEAHTLELGKQIFSTAYQINHFIGNLRIPYIALIDGMTMGGGVGMSVYGKYRVATERTIFAMPETRIGLLPDIGSSYFLPRMKGKLGLYLGLTGTQLKAKDVLYAGIATHYCESSKIPELEQALIGTKNNSDVENVLNKFCPKVNSEFNLANYQAQIDRCFNATTVEKILKNLESDKSEWAQQTRKILRTVSPTSLKVTKRILESGTNLSLGECLQVEYRLAVRLMAEKDFHEGVNALLIRKDNNPKWNPSRIEDVTEDRVRSFFRSLPIDEELQL